jgi:hypothetical protein
MSTKKLLIFPKKYVIMAYGDPRKPIVVSAWCRFVGAFAQKAQAILCVLTSIFGQNDR